MNLKNMTEITSIFLSFVSCQNLVKFAEKDIVLMIGEVDFEVSTQGGPHRPESCRWERSAAAWTPHTTGHSPASIGAEFHPSRAHGGVLVKDGLAEIPREKKGEIYQK